MDRITNVVALCRMHKDQEIHKTLKKKKLKFSVRVLRGSKCQLLQNNKRGGGQNLKKTQEENQEPTGKKSQNGFQ